MPVPEKRNVILQTDGAGVDVTAIGRSVRSGTWIDAARLQNWIAGRGASVVPAHNTFATIPPGDSADFRYRIKPRYAETRYAYHLSIQGRADVTIDGVVAELPGVGGSVVRATILRDRSAQSDAEAELAVQVFAPSSFVYVECIAIEAVPRTLLSASDLGVDRALLWARQPIQADPLSTRMLSQQAALRQSARRSGLYQYSRGTLTPWTRASATPLVLFDGDFSLLGRKLFAGDTDPSGRTAWRALARCTDGMTAGYVQPRRGGSLLGATTIPTGTASWTWLGGTITHDVEDNASANGYRGGGPDDFNLIMGRTAGTGSVQIASVSFFDIGA